MENQGLQPHLQPSSSRRGRWALASSHWGLRSFHILTTGQPGDAFGSGSSKVPDYLEAGLGEWAGVEGVVWDALVSWESGLPGNLAQQSGPWWDVPLLLVHRAQEWGVLVSVVCSFLREGKGWDKGVVARVWCFPAPCEDPGGCEPCDKEEGPTGLAGDGAQACVSQEERRVKEKLPQAWSLLTLRAQAEWAGQRACWEGRTFQESISLNYKCSGWGGGGGREWVGYIISWLLTEDRNVC